MRPLVGLVMGSHSDWNTMRITGNVLEALGIGYVAEVLSAHRTPLEMVDYARTAESRHLEVIIAGAGGAAHLPGMIASLTVLPVLGVPIPSTCLNGLDSLLSIVQMPSKVPVGTLAIDEAGAENAALLAGRILGIKYPAFREAVRERMRYETELVKSQSYIETYEGKDVTA